MGGTAKRPRFGQRLRQSRREQRQVLVLAAADANAAVEGGNRGLADEDALGKHADAIVALKYFFKAYATDGGLRDTIDKGRLTELNVNPAFSMADFKAVPREWRARIPEYVKDYVSLNQFM